MSDLLGGAVVGALVSEALKSLIKEAKKYKDFKPLSEELVSTIDRLLPEILEIESMQNEQAVGVGELKELMDTIEKARALVELFPGVGFFDKPKYTKKIRKINAAMDNFYTKDLQLLQYKNLLRLQGSTGNLAPVYTDYCSVPAKPVNLLVGFECPLMELKKKLLDVSVVNLVVTAPPGCGKTTLVTQLCHDQDIKGKFKHIFYSVVSRNPNLRVIVQRLFQHNGYKDFAFDNDSQAANGLRNLLEKLKGNELEGNDILLVLDDVWGEGELFLKNFQIDLQGYKILVTSRSEFPSFGPTYHLKPLENEDAKNLLIQLASPLPHYTNSDEFEDLLQKILKRCDGFPLIIEVVGISLKGKDLYVWKALVESWSEGEKILDSSSVLERLQPSFSALKPQLKECFMDMGSFLEDQEISASVIIDIWVELYSKGTSSSIVYLNELASQNLLKLINPYRRNEHEDGFYNELLVTQHDILRELAIHQSESEALILKRKRLNLEIRGNEFPDLCLDPTHPIINASLLSISTDESFTSSWVVMDCPNVEVLVLNHSSYYYALPNFIATMKKLKVLIIVNHISYSARLTLTNFSCLTLLPNLKRIRLEKVFVSSVIIYQLQLVRLKKLSFARCSFGDFLHYLLDIDVSKALPSLQEIDIDHCYDLYELPYWVSKVVSLKTLSITNSINLSRLPEFIGNLSKLEVLRLSCCSSLRELPESTDRLSNLKFLDISHCYRLRKLPLGIGKLQKLKKISMMKCGKCHLPDSVINLEDLEVKCDEETASLWERLKPEMRNLSVHEEETVPNLNKFLMIKDLEKKYNIELDFYPPRFSGIFYTCFNKIMFFIFLFCDHICNYMIYNRTR